jgi:mono/diheme cytochrome c family protein
VRLRLSALVALLAVAGLGCRQDMHDQPRYKPFAQSSFFGDGRSARPLVEGTIARGQLREDAVLYTGMQGSKLADQLPFPLTAAVLERGRERFTIYCAPCHGQTGRGDGMVIRRGYRQAASFHSDRLRGEPLGHFFDVMTRGFGAMPDYASQIPPQDRWKIAAYVRVLQLSQFTRAADLSPEQLQAFGLGAAPAASSEASEAHQR